jgi:hypothetical protein
VTGFVRDHRQDDEPELPIIERSVSVAAGMSMMAAMALEGMFAVLVRAVEHVMCVEVMSVSHDADIDLDISDVKI